jgi:hypothetical protein
LSEETDDPTAEHERQEVKLEQQIDSEVNEVTTT